MKRIAVIIAVLASCLVMNAQDAKVKSRVELKGGKADIIGYVESQDDGGYVVETESGDIFYYSASEIKRVTFLEAHNLDDMKSQKVKKSKSEKVRKERIAYDAGGDKSKTRGYMGLLEAGLGLASISYGYEDLNGWHDYYYGVFNPSISFINGYRFSRHFFLGVGVGIDNPLDEFSIPVFLHLRSEFTKKRTAPYIALSGGVTIPYSNDLGSYFEGTLGLRTHCRKHGSFWYGLSVGMINETCGEDYYSDALSFMFKLAYSF